jgi:hypothetical protein
MDDHTDVPIGPELDLHAFLPRDVIRARVVQRFSPSGLHGPIDLEARV